MARKRASMREGPLAELFRATEAAQRAQGEQQPDPSSEVTEVTPPEPEAPVKGMSVLKYDPTGTAADSYRQLAKEVLSNGKR